MHCPMLSGGQFVIAPGRLLACGSASHGMPPTLCTYDGTFDREAFYEGLEVAVAANQTPDGPCVGCRYLTDSGRTTVGRIHSISISDFCGCNSACVYCAGSEFTLPVEFEASADHVAFFSGLLASHMIGDWTTVSWGGGEPSLLSTFDDTVGFLVAHGIRQIINTSGIRYSLAIEGALRSGVADVVISVDSGTDECYARVKRNPNALAVWDSIRRYSAAGDSIVVKYILFAENSSDAEVRAFVTRCVTNGVKGVRISVDARLVNSGTISEGEIAAAALIRNLLVQAGISLCYDGLWPPAALSAIGRA